MQGRSPDESPTARGTNAWRRRFVARSGAVAAWTVVGAGPLGRASAATPQEQQADLDREVAKRLPGVRAAPGRVQIDVPAVAENGHSVPCTVSVDSPMTEADHVRSVTMWAGRNPKPFVIQMRFGPSNPRARLQTRLRLGDSQRLLAIAEMSDGSYWSGVADIEVQLSACEDGSG
ncbi:MAG TPA: thiosulfate oxidation carrier protein SoxY [Burkholderiaceae bacterium]|nr:thiosulfate oxidation carrier protein SoxY [Burkholderiaceae bacterium]